MTAEAILFGLALGGALGTPVEFMSLAAIKEKYGEKGIQEPPDPALYTDETWLNLALIGYRCANDEQKLRELATVSWIAHRHPRSVAVCVVSAYLVKLGVDGVDPSEYVRRVMTFTDGMSEALDSALYRIGHAAAWAEEPALRHIGEGLTGEEAVALAIYCVMKYPNDYVACVRRAANLNGNSPGVACIAGGIMGARLGLEAIPVEWRSRCENGAYLKDLAFRIETAEA